MRVALYTPTDGPDPAAAWDGPGLVHLLARALDVAGHQVLAPSEFRTDAGGEDARKRAALERRAVRHATRLVASYRDLPSVARPEAWLTCRLHHRAPDLIGSVVAETLGIPYLLAGAFYAREESGGAHAGWLSYTARAIARARAVLSLTAEDEESIRPLVASTARLYRLAPFLDPAPYRAADRDAARRALADALPLDPARPWLLAAAPMRPGAALASWRLLGRSLGLIADPAWQLLAVGDGEARALAEAALAPLGQGVTVLAGARSDDALRALYAACDVYVWPAYQEVLSLTVLEAQAAGLPAVARDWPGPAAVIASSETGLLTPQNDDVAFAGAVVELTANAERRRAMGAAAAARARDRHGLATAAATLDRALDAALADA
ncbi:MAG: glycosyltransferase family 4 protein [Rhodospirillales bacterium]|nr:glycosyltransferase family 4 protein [Rhodospirillales bacterium]MDE0379122.1 glycosyltransferase family 4 protein [Rhodospirillales bacterium]